MRLLSFVVFTFLSFLIGGCNSSPSIHQDFENNEFSVVLFPQIEGDTANYVHSRFSAHFAESSNTRLLTYDAINASMLVLGFKGEQYKLSLTQLQVIAKEHGAKGILFGKVKSGARSITSSNDIDSAITLDLVDVQSGKIVISERVEQTMSLLERRSVLRSASDEIIERYENIFAELNQ